MVYIIKTVTDIEYIKIGYTAKDPKRRMQALRTASPVGLELIELRKGSRIIEKLLHGHLAKFRTNGEWFLFSKRCEAKLYQVFNEFKIEKIGDAEIVCKRKGKVDWDLNAKIMDALKYMTTREAAAHFNINKSTIIRHKKYHKEAFPDVSNVFNM